MLANLRRLTLPMIALVAVIALLILGDVAIVTYRLTSGRHAANAPAAQGPKAGKQHPCNHGFYVSKAAHAKKGGSYVSGVAQGNLGKNGSCTAPLPASTSAGSGSDD
jgi:hypothetical protein